MGPIRQGFGPNLAPNFPNGEGCGILPGELFVIPTRAVICHVRIPSRSTLAIYEIEEGRLIAAIRSRRALVAAVADQNFPLLGCFVRSRSELSRELSVAATPLEAIRRRKFYGRIAEPIHSARAILKEAHDELGPETEQALRTTLVNELRATGAPVGDKPSHAANRRVIELLRKTSRRCTASPVNLKDLAPPGRSPDRWANDQLAQIRRFCLRAYKLWHDWGFPDLRVDWLRELLTARCSLEFPTDRDVAIEAFERGTRYAARRHSSPTEL